MITEESQVEQVEMLTQRLDGSIQLCDNAVCDSDCAKLITPPSIYSETSFLGGGDQDLSQGVSQPFATMPTETPSPIADLLEAFPCCADLETFAAVIEWYDDEVIENAIALQPNPLRQQLAQWFEQLSQPESTAGRELAQSTAGFEGKNISQPSPEDALIQKAKRSGKAVYRYIGGILFRGGRSLTAGCLVESLGLDKFGLLMYVQKLGEVWENQKELMLSVDPKKLEPV